MQYLQYKDNILPSVSTILISLVVVLVLWYEVFLPGASMVEAPVVVGDSPLALLWNQHFPFDGWMGRVVALACVIATAYSMIWLNETFSFINVRTILPAFIFAVIVSLVMRPHCFSTSWIIAICIVFFVNTTFRLVEGGADKFIIRAFDAGLILSISALFAVQSLVMTIPFFFLLYRCNSLNVKIVFAYLTGVILPFFYCILVSASLNDLGLWTKYWSSWIVLGGEFSLVSGLEGKIYFGLIGLLFVISLLHFIHTRSHQNVRSREEVFFLVRCLFTTLLIMLMDVNHAQLFLPTCLFFCSFVVGQYFTLEWSLLSKILLVLFLVCSVIYFVQPALI
ncbi:MAG: hypothetical protein IKX43_09435 [Paludibacteraceae bacterium]|nr:hypothetical protein [Paludibacteraceae bacterium]